MKFPYIRPYVVSYGSKSRKQDGFTFILQGKEINIVGVNDILPIFLAQCNGFLTLEKITRSISRTSKYDIGAIEQLAAQLFKYGIIIDAREQYSVFHKVSANPMPFHGTFSKNDLFDMLQVESSLVRQSGNSSTYLEKIFELRASTRNFSGKELTKEEFLRLAWAIYGKTKRSVFFSNSNIGVGTVPSGGALYPLSLYAFSVKVHSFKKNGIYKFSSKGPLMVRTFTQKELAKIFVERPFPFNIKDIAGIFVLVCDFDRVSQKYSNRGYRLALLEAGHAAQNAYLWCAEQGLGIVEMSGFNDEELAKSLNLSYPKQGALTVLVIGRKSDEE